MNASAAPKYFPKAILRRRSKPFAIWAAPPFLVCYALTTALFAILLALDSGEGSITVAGATLSQAQVVWIAAPLALANSALLFALAYGLMAERAWARRIATLGLPITYSVSVIAMAATSARLESILIESIPGFVSIVAIVLYFTRSTAVRAYYRRLER